MRHPIDSEDIWRRVDSVPGWLTRAQALELVRLVRLTPQANVVEIGSHQGRSTLALALSDPRAHITAVDPFITARLFNGPSVRALLLDNLETGGVLAQVTLLTMRSSEALRSWTSTRPVDVLYIDGKHDVVSLLRDMRWRRHIRHGGCIAVHDAFSSIGVTLGLAMTLPFSRTVVLTHRVGSLAVLHVRRPQVGERLRFLVHVPWFARNVLIKILLRLGRSTTAGRLGHTDRFDPY
ncbi:class I SAM-dependent methyltransferase [Janibacter melonis]|nr:class I SAM-dependent methyltransferase [Janibacter melonis]